ncbi:apurinic endonuclease Apn1 [Paenibacillus curdlanolyticus YK9]|uniref:Apurinic endonuclease Apn1 n=1 Tax=Paenibacillus curdlanolyticus YK9 TaxID=717606 RepID=E0I550_9BACL|nr:deoxyribonuclease IV [Paenibacillus curdlanolyticus]EFM12092.1 apurinic endonuclease Apn1 [Paenibacillus curdlanolyticus YK9]
MRHGCHVSTRGGYRAAAAKAAAMGARSYQYFPKNPRSLSVKPFDHADAERCAAFCAANDLQSIAHTPYPTNLAAADLAQRSRTVESLLNDLDIAESCGSIGVVVHFGVYKGVDPLVGYRNIIASLDEVTARWNGQAKLLIENQAGDHAPMGTTFEELATIRSLCQKPESIAYCLDSCHLFASGVWKGEADAQWLETARATDVLPHIAAVHYNDCLYPSGSRKDRHAAIGKGMISTEGLRWLLQVPELEDKPFVLETPTDGVGSHQPQLQLMMDWGKQQ